MASKFPTLLLLLLLVLTPLIEGRASWDDWGLGEDEEQDSKEEEPHGRSIDIGGGGHNHQDGHVAHIMAPVKDSDSPAKSGFSGSNVANYNESCDKLTCNTFNNLRCDQSSLTRPYRCKCLEGFTYIRSQEKCYKIWKADSSDNCEFDDQCHNSGFGPLSNCNRFSGKCVCHDTVTGGKRKVSLHNGVCVIKKEVGEVCETDAECQASMGPNANCKTNRNATGGGGGFLPPSEVCQCRDGYVWDVNLGECLKIASNGPGSDCKSDIQCKSSPLGDLSRCSERKCECHDPKNPGDSNVVYHSSSGVCFERKFMNDTCSLTEECQASIHKNAECSPKKDDYGMGGNMLLICQCKEGLKCGAAGLFVAPALILILQAISHLFNKT